MQFYAHMRLKLFPAAAAVWMRQKFDLWAVPLHSSQVLSPSAWKNEQDGMYVLSLKVLVACCICRPCRDVRCPVMYLDEERVYKKQQLLWM